MNAADFQAFRDSYGLTNDQLAKLFGVTDRTVRNWLAGEIGIPAPVALIINIIRLFSDVREWLNIEERPSTVSTPRAVAARKPASKRPASKSPKRSRPASRRKSSRR